jgi:hypothetical protein
MHIPVVFKLFGSRHPLKRPENFHDTPSIFKNLKWMQKFVRREVFEEFVKSISLFLIMNNIKQLLIEKSKSQISIESTVEGFHTKGWTKIFLVIFRNFLVKIVF